MIFVPSWFQKIAVSKNWNLKKSESQKNRILTILFHSQKIAFSKNVLFNSLNTLCPFLVYFSLIELIKILCRVCCALFGLFKI